MVNILFTMADKSVLRATEVVIAAVWRFESFGGLELMIRSKSLDGDECRRVVVGDIVWYVIFEEKFAVSPERGAALATV